LSTGVDVNVLASFYIILYIIVLCAHCLVPWTHFNRFILSLIDYNIQYKHFMHPIFTLFALCVSVARIYRRRSMYRHTIDSNVA
jgi:hypothetical protein